MNGYVILARRLAMNMPNYVALVRQRRRDMVYYRCAGEAASGVCEPGSLRLVVGWYLLWIALADGPGGLYEKSVLLVM
jgi:hypothetical protein